MSTLHVEYKIFFFLSTFYLEQKVPSTASRPGRSFHFKRAASRSTRVRSGFPALHLQYIRGKRNREMNFNCSPAVTQRAASEWNSKSPTLFFSIALEVTASMGATVKEGVRGRLGVHLPAPAQRSSSAKALYLQTSAC